MDSGLLEGWNQIISLVNSSMGGIFIILASIGALLIIIGVGGWLWKRRKSQGGSAMSGFPWWTVGFGLLLASPQVVFPALLGIFQILLSVGLKLVAWVSSALGA